MPLGWTCIYKVFQRRKAGVNCLEVFGGSRIRENKRACGHLVYSHALLYGTILVYVTHKFCFIWRMKIDEVGGQVGYIRT